MRIGRPPAGGSSSSYDGESNEFLIGSVSGDYVIFEEVTEFRWNGQVGYGNTERALRRTVFPAG